MVKHVRGAHTSATTVSSDSTIENSITLIRRDAYSNVCAAGLRCSEPAYRRRRHIRNVVVLPVATQSSTMLQQYKILAMLCPLWLCGSVCAEKHTYVWTGNAQNGHWADSRNWRSDTGERYPGTHAEDVAIVQPPNSSGLNVYLNRPITLESLTIRQLGIVRSSGHSITLTGHDPLRIERFAQLRFNHQGDSLQIQGDGRIVIDGALVFDARETSLALSKDACLQGTGHVTSLDNTAKLTIAAGTTLTLKLDLIGSVSMASESQQTAVLDNQGLVHARGFPGFIALGDNLILKDAPGGVRWMASGFGAELLFNRSTGDATPHAPSLKGDFAIESWGAICLGPDVEVETTGSLVAFQGSIVADDDSRLRTADRDFQGHVSSLVVEESGAEASKPSS